MIGREYGQKRFFQHDLGLKAALVDSSAEDRDVDCPLLKRIELSGRREFPQPQAQLRISFLEASDDLRKPADERGCRETDRERAGPSQGCASSLLHVIGKLGDEPSGRVGKYFPRRGEPYLWPPFEQQIAD